MGVLVVIILLAVALAILIDSKCGCFGAIFAIIALVLSVVICISGLNSLENISAQEKVIISKNVTTTYELVPLDFATYEKDPELSERNASNYIHIGDKEVFTFCYKTTQDGVEGFTPGSIYSTNVFFPDSYVGNPKILEITTVYKYSLNWFQRIWFFGTGIEKEKNTVTHEIYIPETSTFSYEQ